MRISIIILTYNSEKYITDLLHSLILRYHEEIKDKTIEILVADNKSSDDTIKQAKKNKEIYVLENGGNLGFAAGINNAAKKATGDTLIFINPDAKLVDGNLFNIASEFDDEKVGVVGGKILNFKGNRELSCGKTYTFPRVFLLALGLEEIMGVRFAPETRQEVDHVSGAFLAIRKSLFEKLQGFDEHYFMYIEDADLCFRVKKAGYKVIFSPVATLQHIGQGSSNREFAVINIYKGLVYFHKKHIGYMSYLLVKFLLQLKAIFLVIFGKISNNQYLVQAYEKALSAI